MNFVRNRTILKVLFCASLILGSAATVMAVKPITFGITATKTKVGSSWDKGMTWSAGQHSLAILGSDIYGTWVNQSKELFVSVSRGNSGYFESKNTVFSGVDSNVGATIAAAFNSKTNQPEIHLSWAGQSPGDNIYYSRSSMHAPYNWVEQVVQGTTPGNHWGASIAVDAANVDPVTGFYDVHIAYHTANGAIYVVTSPDGGTSWQSPVQINLNTPPLTNLVPSIAVDGIGDLHVAWLNRSTPPHTIYYCKGSFNNITRNWEWSENVTPINQDPVDGTLKSGNFVSLATSQNGQGVYVSWNSSGIGTMCAFSNDSGTNWDQSVVNSGGTDSDTSIAVSPSTSEVSVAYKVGQQMYLSRSFDQGQSWAQTVAIDDASYDDFPNLAVGMDKVAHIMWTDSDMIAYTREQ
jgi:hypothetical protein